MEKKLQVGIVGATGMVGQRFVTLLRNHPWFEVKALAASSRSAGRTYGEAVQGRWAMKETIPEAMAAMTVADASDLDTLAGLDFVFCAVDMDKAATRVLEESYARAEIPVISNNSANRMTPDVPMVIPELNPEHLEVITQQRRRLGCRRGFIAVKPNCSIQSYVPALHPLRDFGVRRVLACTYQAISGASKTFETWPEMVDNLIPFIGGEEQKSEQEPLKVWGKLTAEGIVSVREPSITTQCLRVPISDGHMAAVFVDFDRKPDKEEMIARWHSFEGLPQKLNLPSAPKPFLYYFTQDNMPQTRLHRDLGGGMAVSIGRLREDSQYQYKFVCLSHNTLRGAAGGGLLTAELLCAQGYFK